MTDYHRAHAGAIAMGTLCAALAGAVLTESALRTGPTIDHALSIGALVITIAAGHMAIAALRGWHVLRTLGLATVFLGGVTYTIVATAGRTAEQQQTASAGVDLRDKARADKQAELERARLRYEQAEAQAEREMTGSRCGDRCKDWKLRASEVDAKVKRLEGELARLGAETPANGRLVAFAELLEVLAGVDRAATMHRLTVAWPYLLPLLLELGSIVFWSMGMSSCGAPSGADLRHPARGLTVVAPSVAHQQPARAETPQTSFPISHPLPAPALFAAPLPDETDPTPPRGSRRRRDQAAREAKVRSFSAAFIARHGRHPSSREIASACGLPSTTAWRVQSRIAA